MPESFWSLLKAALLAKMSCCSVFGIQPAALWRLWALFLPEALIISYVFPLPVAKQPSLTSLTHGCIQCDSISHMVIDLFILLVLKSICKLVLVVLTYLCSGKNFWMIRNKGPTTTYEIKFIQPNTKPLVSWNEKYVKPKEIKKNGTTGIILG